MISMGFFYAAIALITIGLICNAINYISKRKVDVYTITRNTGNKNLILTDSGKNKATVLATLRQITGINYENAKSIVDSAPLTFMTKVSEQEADLTQKALEFVGAKVEIK